MGNKWKIMLFQVGEDAAELCNTRDLGWSSPTAELCYAAKAIKEFLEGEGSNLCDAELVSKDVVQMLTLKGLMAWHNLRLAWGNSNPEENFKCFPNGEDLNWKLYWCGNGLQRVKLEGSLPENWYELSEPERWNLVEMLSWEE